MPRRSRTARSPTSSGSDRRRLAIDLGGTKVVAALVDATGRIVRPGPRLEHGNRGVDEVVTATVEVARSVLAGSPLPPGPVGLSIAAQVDPIRGTVVHAPNLKWRNVPLGRRLEAAFGRPVRLLNDGHAATFAEWTRGA
ncbi:MAG TPA: ROK family protein, partial [Thermoplasmata archaeon]|nr:ROK family protein [Thermoplasmata archaeon]